MDRMGMFRRLSECVTQLNERERTEPERQLEKLRDDIAIEAMKAHLALDMYERGELMPHEVAVNVYPFCGVVKMPEGWNTFANQETDTNPSETISNPEIDTPKREALSKEEILKRWDVAVRNGHIDRATFIYGVRFAERHHGIGGEG